MVPLWSCASCSPDVTEPGFLDSRLMRHSRVGSSSGSGVSCGGRDSSGTWRRFTRMRVHVDDLPRIESTKTSSTARCLATSACLLFHLSRPASAASLWGEFATTRSGIFVRGFFVAALTREGATRGASPSICENAAARVRHQTRLPHLLTRVPATFRANPAQRPCLRADRRTPRNASEL